MAEFWSNEINCTESEPPVPTVEFDLSGWVDLPNSGFNATLLPDTTVSTNMLHSSLDVAVDPTGKCHVVAKRYPLLVVDTPPSRYQVAVQAWVDDGAGAWSGRYVVLGKPSVSPSGYGWGDRGLWRSHAARLALTNGYDGNKVALFLPSNFDEAYGATEKRRLPAPPVAVNGVWPEAAYNALSEVGGTGQDIVPFDACASDTHQYVVGFASTTSAYTFAEAAIGYRTSGSMTGVVLDRTPDVSLSNGGPRSAACCIDDNGYCHAVFSGREDGTSDAVVLYAKPTSATAWTVSELFSYAEIDNPYAEFLPQPSLSFDPVTGNLILVYSDQDATINARYSDDGGSTWSSELELFSGSVKSAPSIASIATGHTIAVWAASSGDDSLGEGIRYIVSADGGVTWSEPALIPGESAITGWTKYYAASSPASDIRVKAHGNLAVIAGFVYSNPIRAIRWGWLS